MAISDLDNTNLFNSASAVDGLLLTTSEDEVVIRKNINSSFLQTNAIQVKNGDTFLIYSPTGTGGAYYASFFNNSSNIADKRNIIDIDKVTPQYSSNGASLTIYNVPKKADYVSFAALESRKSALKITRNLLFKDLCAIGVLYMGKGKATDDIFFQSNVIPVNAGDILSLYLFTNGTSKYYLSHLSDNYLSDETVIKSVEITPTDGYAEYTVPDGVDYISVGGLTRNIDSAIINKTNKTYSQGSIIHHAVFGDKTNELCDNVSRNRLGKALNTTGITNISSKVINCLGDSITYGYISSGLRANPTWPSGVSDNLGCVVNNYGVSATSICDGSSESFITRLNRMTESSVDVLLIFGGTNDYGDNRAHTLGTITDSPAQGTNFYASFKYLIEQAVTKYPSAIIGIITPLRRSRYTENKYNISIEDIVNAEIEVARHYGCPVLDMFHEGNLNPEISIHSTTYTADGLHPNQNGINRFLIPKISEFSLKLLSYVY